VLQAADAVCGHGELLLIEHRGAVLSRLLPALASAVGGQQRDTEARFLCLNLLCHVVLSLASEPGDAAAAAALDAAVAADILPLAPALLEEDEPTPLYALKALGLMAGGPPPVGSPAGAPWRCRTLL
jgi:hypothetical protein